MTIAEAVKILNEGWYLGYRVFPGSPLMQEARDKLESPTPYEQWYLRNHGQPAFRPVPRASNLEKTP